jgi:hypothetical protein
MTNNKLLFLKDKSSNFTENFSFQTNQLKDTTNGRYINIKNGDGS